VAAFSRLSPARHAARRLLAAGPVVGGCWAAALITGRAWTWPVPAADRFLFGVVLITVIGLLAVAAFGQRYLSARRAGAVACMGITVLDGVMLITVMLAIPVLIWPVILAAAASAARLIFSARALRVILTG
jgi:hypothetical protein